MNKATVRILVILGVALVFLVAAPFVLSTVSVRMMVEIAYFSLFAISYNFLFGYTGLLSFGHSSSFGVGAYITALALKHMTGMHLLLAMLVGALGAGLVGSVIGFFCVRRKGAYFALLTLAFNQFLWATAWKWRSLTGGDDGLGGFVPKSPVNMGFFRMDLGDTTTIYFFVLTIVLIFLALGWYIMQTPFGNTIRAIKVNEDRAAFLGYNPIRSKLYVFILSSFYAGLAGSLFAVFQDMVATSSIDAAMSTEVIFMAFLGGTGSYFGPVLGATIFVYFTNWISSLTDRWEFILGVLFVLLVLFFRQGFIGLVPARWKAALVKDNSNRK